MKRSSEQNNGAADGGAFSEMDSLFALLGMFDLPCAATEPESGEQGDWPDEQIMMDELRD